MLHHPLFNLVFIKSINFELLIFFTNLLSNSLGQLLIYLIILASLPQLSVVFMLHQSTNQHFINLIVVVLTFPNYFNSP